MMEQNNKNNTIITYQKILKPIVDKENNNFAGIRKDIGHFAINSYEANIYRILQYENKAYDREYDYVFPLNLSSDNVHDNIIHYKINIRDIEGFFGVPNAFIKIEQIANKQTAIEQTANGQSANEKIRLFREQYPDERLLIIGSVDEQYENVFDIWYSDLEKKYKPLILLWEDKTQNIKNKPELYKKQWEIGKREKKRKHKKFFKIEENMMKTGELWKRPCQIGLHGRPKGKNNTFIDLFEIRDEDNNSIEQNENWGAILARIGQRIKDNPLQYYNTGKKMSVWYRIKKTQEWNKIVEYDTIKNYWFI